MKKEGKSHTNQEIEKYKQISKMVAEAQKEVLIFVKKNQQNDPRLRISGISC